MKLYKKLFALVVCAFVLNAAAISFGQGIILPQAGAVNRSMGGAATAAPLDPIGANYWNPATISGFESSQLSSGVELLWPVLETSSSVGGGAFGGTSQSESGVIPLPQIGWVHKTQNPRITIGLGIVAVGGVKTNYSSSTTNPILLPQSLGGFGQVYTEAQFLQILPNISFAVTDRLSIAAGPVVNLAQVVVVPNVFAAPDDANGDLAPSYPAGRGSYNRWGGGAQFGVFYRAPNCWNLGAAVKTPQWIQTQELTGTDENGFPRVDRFKFDLPLLVTAGAAYRGIPRTTWAIDARYTNYSDTTGWGPSGFKPDGSLAGLGFEDALTVATGLQYELFTDVDIRAGYSYTSDVLTNDEATVAVFAPLVYNHLMSTGASLALSESVSLDAAYTFVFQSERSGPIVTPAGPVPGSNVTTSVTAHIMSFGISAKY